MNSQDSIFKNVHSHKLVMNFEQFCSGSSSLSNYSENTRSNSHYDFKGDQNFNSSLTILKEMPGDNLYSEKRKNKKKGKGSSLGKRKRQQNRIRKSEN